ncbi:MAG: signal peptide peptidase SppA [Rickettsiales bacterium]|nr:signal peptide peptidase SppA [Rickettsiales bacterium]OUT44208.1 MAG: signal peptide peptidase SppA [Pelagibacteraceae bacterium TMED13]|tara:strand:+ start:1697 stop:2590 length:894 start_codon:yes stop_codon:yes gene_type:complete
MKRNEILEKYLSKRSLIVKRFATVLISIILIFSFFLFTSKKKDFIATISIEGIISNPEDTLNDLENINKSSNAKALLVNINSPGGTFVSSKELYDKIKEISKKIPVVTYMREMATSGGYLVSLASQKIFSNIGTITGSVGVILQTAEITELLEKIGINPIVIKSGKLKATPNPLEGLSENDSRYLNDVIKSMQLEFLSILSENRNIESKTLEIISDGRIFTGKQAKELNLIDFIGSKSDAIRWLKDEAKLPQDIDILDYSKENQYEKLISMRLFDKNFNFLKKNIYSGFLAIWDPKL